jgi:cholestenol delta-isomerase
MFWSSKTPEPLKASPVPHPYVPVSVEIANFVANDKDFVTLVGLFGIGCAVILGGSWVAVSTFARVKLLDKWVLLWFVLTGSIHLWFEGYFSYNHARMGPAQDLFGQLWKE